MTADITPSAFAAQSGNVTLDIHLLGPPEIWWADRALSIQRRLPRALLYRLAVQLQPVPREQLCFLFWPDHPDDVARRNLTVQLAHLRRALPAPQALISVRGQVGLDPSCARSDALAFERLSGAPHAIESLQQAVDLYRGPFLDGVSLSGSAEFETWAAQERSRLERQYLESLSILIAAYVARGAYPAAIDCAQRYLAVDELAEEVHRQLIELYAASGDRAAAIRQFERCASVLNRELDVEPLPETRRAYQAVLEGAIRPSAPAADPACSIATCLTVPLVGRDEVLQRLGQAFARARSGQGGVILIVGEPGIGKSRLLREFAARVGDRAAVLSGAAYPEVQPLPYSPIVAAHRAALQAAPAFPAMSRGPARAPWPVWLSDAARLLPELRDIVPGLPAPDPIPLDQVHARTLEALSRLTLSRARAHPAVLLLDDLHYADQSTLDWLAYLGRQLAGQCLLVIGAYEEPASPPLAELSHQLRKLGLLSILSLGLLDRTSLGAILRHLYAEDPALEAATTRLQQATGGNPLFVMETLRALIESGQPLRDLVCMEDLPLSEALRAIVSQRLGYLSTLARQVLESGAVLGSTFGVGLLRRAAGRSEMETLDALDELVERQFLQEHAGEYRFRHALIREAVYGQMSPGRRRLLHRRAGEALEGQPDGGQARAGRAVDLARHFGAAGLADKVERYAREAGELSARLLSGAECSLPSGGGF